MGKSLTRKIIESHFVSGDMTPGKEIFIKVDQTLTHDINAVMTYLAFEAIGLDRVRTECSVSYLDHNLLYVDNKTPDDHIYLQSAAKKFGVYVSRPGNGICHTVHVSRFGVPGKVSMGGDSHTPHGGALGYVSCAEEVLRQLFDRGLAIDHMVVPSGSAGTHAGIIAGMVGNNAGIPVTGIGVNRKKPVQEAAVLNLANETLEYIGAEARVPAEKVVAFDDYVGPGYSLPTDAMVEAVKMLARTEGILLDPVYSGKAMSGLIDLARKGYFPKGSNVLFLHTGGSPALYAYLPTFRA